jgi:pheromone shutdown protein TraB
VRVVERTTPVAAVITALSSLACCLPFSFVGAIGLAGASARLQALRPWFLAGAGVLLFAGFIQLYVRKNQCARRSKLSVAIFWVATALVLLLILFPQIIASLLAG